MTEQPNNPLHGVTLKAMLEYLIERIGWEKMAERVNILCFTNEPSLTSSLKFLRKVPWARDKVERLYVRTLKREERRAVRREQRREQHRDAEPPEE